MTLIERCNPSPATVANRAAALLLTLTDPGAAVVADHRAYVAEQAVIDEDDTGDLLATKERDDRFAME